MVAEMLALVYALLYPSCTVSVYAIDRGVYGEFIALDDFPNTASTCGGQQTVVNRTYGRDILVQVCECRAPATCNPSGKNHSVCH